MRYLVRIDDVTQYMDRSRFEKVRSILDDNDIRPIIGVVPDCRDESIQAGEDQGYTEAEYRTLLTELRKKGWVIAMHGINHMYTTSESGLLGINPFSEFAGLPYDAQYTKLKQGREIMRRLGHDTNLFMAPGHSLDLNTLRALKTLGFTAVTDGLYHEPYIREGILFVPCTLVSYDRMKGTDTICLHPNNMDDEAMDKLAGFLRRHRDEAFTYDEDSLRDTAVEYGPAVAVAEAGVLKMRQKRNDIASSTKLSGYMSYTYHENKLIKWTKRILFSPLLLTGRFDRPGSDRDR